jgi:hypothetical protein
MISPDDLFLYRITDSWQTAADEVTDFYRVYHSMRYVKRRLVMRLQRAPSPETLDGINQDFADILTAGKFEISKALPMEHDDEPILHLPRLVFQFNRRSLGRLRQLIDRLNSEPEPSEIAIQNAAP